MESLNRQALSWCRRADGKVHLTTCKIPLQESERENLHDLPPQEMLDKYRWEMWIVTRDGMVSFDGFATVCRGNTAAKKCAFAYAPVVWKSTMARFFWQTTRRSTILATSFSCKGNIAVSQRETVSLCHFHVSVKKMALWKSVS